MADLLLMMAEFFKTGLFAVGGGLATIPFLQEMAGRYGWFDTATLSTMIAVSESTPGPMGVNMATYVGYTTHGPAGAVAATLSLVAPSVIVILMIANMLDRFKQSRIVQNVFVGIRPFVVGLILAACFDIFLTTLFVPGAKTLVGMISWSHIALFGVGLFCYRKFRIHPILIIVAGGVLGAVLGL